LKLFDTLLEIGCRREKRSKNSIFKNIIYEGPLKSSTICQQFFIPFHIDIANFSPIPFPFIFPSIFFLALSSVVFLLFCWKAYKKKCCYKSYGWCKKVMTFFSLQRILTGDGELLQHQKSRTTKKMWEASLLFFIELVDNQVTIALKNSFSLDHFFYSSWWYRGWVMLKSAYKKLKR